MGQITISLNNRTYRLSCGPGEEARLRELADHLGLRIERLAMDFGQHGDERLLVMAALLATDELLDAKSRLAAAEAGAASADAEVAPREADAAAAAGPTHAPEADVAREPAEPIAPVVAPVAANPTTAPARTTPPRNTLEARLAAAKASAVPNKAGAA